MHRHCAAWLPVLAMVVCLTGCVAARRADRTGEMIPVRVELRVCDAGTGQPVANAIVHYAAGLISFKGMTMATDDRGRLLTGPDGTCSVATRIVVRPASLFDDGADYLSFNGLRMSVLHPEYAAWYERFADCDLAGREVIRYTVLLPSPEQAVSDVSVGHGLRALANMLCGWNRVEKVGDGDVPDSYVFDRAHAADRYAAACAMLCHVLPESMDTATARAVTLARQDIEEGLRRLREPRRVRVPLYVPPAFMLRNHIPWRDGDVLWRDDGDTAAEEN